MRTIKSRTKGVGNEKKDECASEREDGRARERRRRTECCEIETAGYEAGTGRKKGSSGRRDKVRCARLPSGVSRIICIIRVESFSLGALMGLWDPRFGYRFLFPFFVLHRTSGKEVKIRITASVLYFVVSDAIE